MTNLHCNLTSAGRVARQVATTDLINPVTAPLVALGVPLLIGLFQLHGYGVLYGALPVLAIALLVTAAGEAWYRRAPIVVGALILLLITGTLLAARLIPWSENSTGLGSVFGLPIGCAGLAGCSAGWRWLRSGGCRWAGSLLWIGGWIDLAGAALCVAADTSAGDGNDGWDALGYLVMGGFLAIVGSLLMLIGGIARVVRLRRAAGVRSSAARPAGGR